jgi:hypothetical protein
MKTVLFACLLTQAQIIAFLFVPSIQHHGHDTDRTIASVDKSRREFMMSWQAPTFLFVLSVVPYSAEAYVRSILLQSTEELSAYIQQNCNQRFLQCVKASDYNFLYRGEVIKRSQDERISAFIIKEPSDLLDERTYQSTEAAAYFRQLENELSLRGSKVKPSNGHIATTCPKEAAKWGTAVSIWPLGESNVNFAWLKYGGLFWPPPDNTTEDRLVQISHDSGLAQALQGDAWEIMFRADKGYIAVPAEYDDELKIALSQR